MKYIFFMLMLNISSLVYSQVWINSTPEFLQINEFADNKVIENNMIRPIISDSDKNLILGYEFESYFNNNFPNQENMGNKYFTKGLGSFFGYKIAFKSKYFFISAEPFLLKVDSHTLESPSFPDSYTNQNIAVRPLERPGSFKWLNDRQLDKNQEIDFSGIREIQIYLKFKNLMTGVSNVNRWWGSGIHTSLSMSNNTAGFPHYYLGLSNSNLFSKNIIFNMNYIVGEVGKYQRPYYFTGLVSTITHKSIENDITLGFTRTYVSGGIRLPGNRQWTIADAAALPLEGLLLSSKKDLWYTEGKGVDRWDQILTVMAQGYFKKSRLKVFFEIGFNDHAHNLYELRAHWDVSAAYLYGIRKKGLFGNENILFGVEYLDLIQRTFSDHRGTTGTWFDESIYKSNTYNGRRWSAHSGIDSDDFYFYLGYQGRNFTIIPAFNYERHGVVYHFPPEVKLEFRLTIAYSKKNWNFLLFYENEYFENLGFVNSNDNVWLNSPLPGSLRKSNTLKLSIQNNLKFFVK